MAQIGLNITSIREKLGLTQEDLAKMLDMGRSTIAQIENGKRKVTVEELMKFAASLNTTTEILLNPDLSPDEVVEYSLKEDAADYSRERISIPQNNFRKFREVLLYILGKIGAKPHIGETVIYKLLYFIDFDYYEKYEEQLIGATYIRNKYGPTPTHFRKLVDSMLESGDLAAVAKEYFTYPQTKYLPLRKADIRLLSASELATIDQVISRLGDMNAKQISEYSHKDIPWMTASDGGRIDYEAVFYRTPEYSVREEEQRRVEKAK